MLKLKNITKTYVSGEEKVQALKGIDIEFRKSEFVSILGQSGCGKTTLLNIIGGLDRYTEGDLIINGKSTKDFKDRDWDSYRNYSVGFVFQSYNLIPHQSVLANVELALTISGYSSDEKRTKSIEALKSVGLGDQIHKKPSQLSGGQMQRVAIARAIVNNPDIILADEPTGALDTTTSVQIMELLKKISKDKLIIMVTHNPELAEKYSNRIVRLLDGKITDDSNPYKEEKEIKKAEKKERKTQMKFTTAFKLSLNNLMTKKGRTILTSFAGSIGIIGIALILSISTGVQNYINQVEEDTLSSYPITIEKTAVDMTSLMETMMGEVKSNNQEKEDSKIYSTDIMNDMLSTLSNKKSNNNLKELKKYLEEENNEVANNSNAIKYNYDLSLNLYKNDITNGVVQVNPSTLMDAFGMQAANTSTMSMMMGSSTTSMLTNTDVWIELLDNDELVQAQYDIVAGTWPKNYNEVAIVVDSNNNISDYTLYTLGLKDQKEIKEKWEKIQKGETVEKSEETSYTYDELLNLSYKVLLNSDYYKKENGVWLDKSEDESYIKQKIENADTIKVSAIIKKNDQRVASTTTEGIAYRKELKEYVINKNNESEIVNEQKENKEVNVFSGLNFPVDDENGTFNYGNLTTEQQMKLASLSAEEISQLMAAYNDNKNSSYESNLQKLGAIDIDNPSAISIYPKDFKSKEAIVTAIENYNQKQRDEGNESNVITYTDTVGIMMKSVTQIVNIISYVLIAFVSISLVVSSIMIAIITYISVLERTKEIGILRAMGTSKKDVSKIFNAETFIEGLFAGVMGIVITLILNIPINGIIKAITGIYGIALLPINGAVILIAISVILTVVAGLVPSKLAAKKDPAVVLRSE